MRRLAREHPGRTKRAINDIARRARRVRNARAALAEAEIHVIDCVLHQLAEWRANDPARFEEALSRKFDSCRELKVQWQAMVRRLEANA